MLHVSPSPVEIGCFDPDVANILATKIKNNHYPSIQTENSGRIVLSREQDILQVLGSIGFYSAVNDDSTMVRNRVYAQDFAEIDTTKFTGLPWHIDAEGIKGSPSVAFDFNFGFSHHSTEAFVGQLDLTGLRTSIFHDLDTDAFLSAMSTPMILRLSPSQTEKAIEEAQKKGEGELFRLEEGVLYHMPAGMVHRMQPFDQDYEYPARLCIEQYLKSAM
jgi:hypothetical protein